MSDENINLTVLDYDIAFRTGADMERARNAARLLEERFADQKLRSRGGGRDMLLTFLALGLADDLLQLKNMQNDARRRIAALLARIEKSENDPADNS